MTTCDDTGNLTGEQLTRVKLLGMGIVCGLEVFRDAQCFISISKGVGVTSTGQVICIPDKTLKYYREYRDPDNYFNSICKDQHHQYKLYELIEHRENANDGLKPIVPQDLADLEKPFLENKVVLLYLEDEVKMQVRILLIDEQDMWAILKCGCITHTHCIESEPEEDEDISIFDRPSKGSLPGDENLYNAVHKKYMLKYVPIRRFGYGNVDIGDLVIGNESENLSPDFDFFDTDTEKAGRNFFHAYAVIIDEALKKLDDEIDKLHDHFGCLIDKCHCKETGNDGNHETHSPCNPLNANTTAETGLQVHNIKIFKSYFSLINKKWSRFKKNRRPAESVQYFYDFVKDLVITYNELLDELYELVNDCCAGTNCFPRYIMLGRIKEEVSFQSSVFRQEYLQPPVYNGNANRLQQVRFLHWRMVIMMKCFFMPDWELDDFSDENYLDVLSMKNKTKPGNDAVDHLPLRITPSRMYSEPLGKQTIPFYYNLSNSPYSLQHYWDYFSTKHKRADQQLSYFSKEKPGYTNHDFIIHPFVYSLSQYPFYRIEGHTGMNVDDAVDSILNLRKRYDLGFNVAILSVKELKELAALDYDGLQAFYGLEHVGGVQKGYTFILLHDERAPDNNDPVYPKGNVVIADFQVPFVRGSIVTAKTISSPGTAGTPSVKEFKITGKQWDLLEQKIGPATGDDDLKKIKGISDKTEKLLKAAGISTYLQLSKIEEADIPVLCWKIEKPSFFVKPDWIKQAAELIHPG